MTREEAIKIFNTVLLFGKCDCPKEEIEECLKMAIKALEQEPCEDSISREDTMTALRADPSFICPGDQLSAIRIVEGMPPVNPQPKIGHWISHREHCEMNNLIPSGLGSYFWCSECNCGIDAGEWHMNNYNYCPNCGCRMIEPQESEDKE